MAREQRYKFLCRKTMVLLSLRGPDAAQETEKL